MKKLFLTIACVCVTAAGVHGQTTSSFSLTDSNGATSGTYNPTATFTLNLSGTITGIPSGFTADGFSLFLEAPTASNVNSTISITDGTYFQFTGFPPSYPQTFTQSLGSPDSNYATTEDLGAIAGSNSQRTGNFTNRPLASYTFSLNGAPAGTTFMILSTSGSGISYSNPTNNDFRFANAPQVAYTITVVPEPATWASFILGGVGLAGIKLLPRRRVS